MAPAWLFNSAMASILFIADIIHQIRKGWVRTSPPSFRGASHKRVCASSIARRRRRKHPDGRAMASEPGIQRSGGIFTVSDSGLTCCVRCPGMTKRNSLVLVRQIQFRRFARRGGGPRQVELEKLRQRVLLGNAGGASRRRRPPRRRGRGARRQAIAGARCRGWSACAFSVPPPPSRSSAGCGRDSRERPRGTMSIRSGGQALRRSAAFQAA